MCVWLYKRTGELVEGEIAEWIADEWLSRLVRLVDEHDEWVNGWISE